MAVYLPIDTWIQYGEISAYLADNASATNSIFRGEDLVPSLSAKIRLVTKSLAWRFSIDPNDESLNDVALYLYALCGRFVLEAKRILGQGQAGQVINPSTGTTVTIKTPVLQFRIGYPGSLMNAGDTTLTLAGYENVINPSVEITLDGVELPYGVGDRISYTASYNNDDEEIVIVFNQGVTDTQLYRIRFIQLINVGIPASLGQETTIGGIFTGNL